MKTAMTLLALWMFSPFAGTPQTEITVKPAVKEVQRISVKEVISTSVKEVPVTSVKAAATKAVTKASLSVKSANKQPNLSKIKVETKTAGIKSSRSQKLASRGGSFIVMHASLSAYSGNCKIQGTGSRTSLGRNAGIPDGCAVDPRVIPLGSIVEYQGEKRIADDTGRKIKGNRIDWRVSNYKAAIQFGLRSGTVRVYRRGSR